MLHTPQQPIRNKPCPIPFMRASRVGFQPSTGLTQLLFDVQQWKLANQIDIRGFRNLKAVGAVPHHFQTLLMACCLYTSSIGLVPVSCSGCLGAATIVHRCSIGRHGRTDAPLAIGCGRTGQRIGILACGRQYLIPGGPPFTTAGQTDNDTLLY